LPNTDAECSNEECPHFNVPKPADRILGRIVLDAFGRDLRTFQTVNELLRCIRSALKGHRELFIKYNILHCDISSSNILLPWPSSKKERQALEAKLKGKGQQRDYEEEVESDGTSVTEESKVSDDGRKGDRNHRMPESLSSEGFLIDLDYAVDIHRPEPSGARLGIGTTTFMAIELLKVDGAENSYFHDLHSFFYVLLWTLSERSPEFRQSEIYGWAKHWNDYRLLGTVKTSLLIPFGWEPYLAEALCAWAVTPEKPSKSAEYEALEKLLEGWRDICFPKRMAITKEFERMAKQKNISRKDWEDDMYYGMLAALDEAIGEV
jgi:hypothetical protein